MGTNYYAKLIPTAQHIETMQSLLDARDFNGLQVVLDRLKEFHVCKTSLGWRVLFQRQDDRYNGYDACMKYLEDCEIWDEYHRPATVPEIKEWCKHKAVDKAHTTMFNYQREGNVDWTSSDFF